MVIGHHHTHQEKTTQLALKMTLLLFEDTIGNEIPNLPFNRILLEITENYTKAQLKNFIFYLALSLRVNPKHITTSYIVTFSVPYQQGEKLTKTFVSIEKDCF